MHIAPELKERIKTEIDMIELANEYTELKQDGNRHIGLCPLPGHNDSDPSFVVFPETNSWYCFGGCKKGGDVIGFIKEMHKLSFEQSAVFLAKKLGVTIESTNTDKKTKDLSDIAMKHHNRWKTIKDWLMNRGLNDQSIRDWMIGYDGEFVTIPLLDKHKRTVGILKRRIEDDDSPRYRNPVGSQFVKQEYLYGVHDIDTSINDLYIVEGAFDCILAKQYGLQNVVSTLGTELHDKQIKWIKEHGFTPIFCFDNDNTGRLATAEAVEKLLIYGVHSKILPITIGEKADMADLANHMNDELVQYAKTNAITHSIYQANDVIMSYLSSITQIQLNLIPQIKRMKNEIVSIDEYNVIKSLFTHKLGLDIDNLL